jgi:hypothetical protein
MEYYYILTSYYYYYYYYYITGVSVLIGKPTQKADMKPCSE